jgi:hypothetical protein
MFTKGTTIFEVVDEGFLEVFGATGLTIFFSKSLNYIRQLFNGNITDYLIYMTFSIVTLYIFIF